MPAQTKQYKQISQVLLFRDKTGTFGSTTLNSASIVGATTLTVASITNFAINRPIRVGAGEEMELVMTHLSTAPSGNTITLATGLKYAHAVGEAVVEQVAYDIGDITDEGATVSFTSDATDVQVATKRLVYTTLNGYVDASVELKLPGFSLYNFAAAVGAQLSAITGAGTQASPTQLVTDGNEFAAESNMSLVIIGVLKDGTPWRTELWSVDMDYTGVTMQMTRGTLASVPLKAVGAAGGIMSTNVSPYTGDVTNRPGKGKVFDSLVEVGTFTPHGTPGNTTVSTLAAAGATTLVLTSGTSYAPGDWIKVGSGDTVEYHWVQTVVTNTLTLRTRLLRAQAIGTAVQRQAQTPFVGVSVDGATLTLGGSVEVQRIATKRQSIGLRAGAASISLAFAITELSLANVAQALGIPSSAIAGGVLEINTNIGTTTVDGVYVKGLLQDGTYVWVNVWGCSQDISAFAMTLNNAGAAPTLPFALKPASGLQLLNHA